MPIVENTSSRLLENAKALHPFLTGLRRKLHRHPEAGLHLPNTQKQVLEALSDLNLEITLGQDMSSIVAVLRGGRPGPAVLLRGDMDALRITEETGLDFSSEVPGIMHACGHDLHTSGLVGAAHLLAERREELQGSVMFMFQPGEEGQDGARRMLEEGLLEVAGEKPIAAYGIHVMSGKRGMFGTRPGCVMVGGTGYVIEIHGRGGHGSMPSKCVDPTIPLAAISDALRNIAGAEFGIDDPIVVSSPKIIAGTTANAIPNDALLEGTFRALSNESLDRYSKRIEEAVTHIAAAYGCSATTTFRLTYPPTINDEDETDFVLGALAELFGADRVDRMHTPSMGSEDFSHVLKEVPGTFLILGTGGEEISNHSPNVIFDDAVLADQAALLAHLALERLNRVPTE